MFTRLRHARLALLAVVVLITSLAGGTVQAARPADHAADNGSLTVFAASSLTSAFTTIGAAFDKANNATVRFNFASPTPWSRRCRKGRPPTCSPRPTRRR